MEMDEYQKETGKTAQLPDDGEISFLALGLNGEAGEVAEKIKKSIRDGNDLELEKELGDVLWYLSRLADELGHDLDEVAETNLDKLFDRKERGKIKGDGDNR